MARFHIAAALVSATFALLIILQLLSSFGFPKLDFLQLRYEAPFRQQESHRNPINSSATSSGVSDDGTQYLLGVGKADITGYTLSALATRSC